MRSAVAASALALLTCGVANAATPPADPNWTCVPRHPSTRVDSLKKIPLPIRITLRRIAGAMADRGEFFNDSDDVSRPAPFSRFIRGGEIGTRWFVWYEHGGRSYSRIVVLFGADGSGKTVVLIDRPAKTPDLCAMTDDLLDGMR